MFRITFVIVFCTSLLACGAQDSELEHRLKHLEQEVHSLRSKVERMERSYDQAWSCHSTQDWTANDVIEFDSCDVSTVPGDPALGLVPITEAGTYRLTFMGLIALASADSDVYAEVRLKVNNEVIAAAALSDYESDETERGAQGSVAIDVLRELEANDIVSIEASFVKAYLRSDANAFTHWTGQRLPSAARA